MINYDGGGHPLVSSMMRIITTLLVFVSAQAVPIEELHSDVGMTLTDTHHVELIHPVTDWVNSPLPLFSGQPTHVGPECVAQIQRTERFCVDGQVVTVELMNLDVVGLGGAPKWQIQSQFERLNSCVQVDLTAQPHHLNQLTPGKEDYPCPAKAWVRADVVIRYTPRQY